MAKTLTTLIQSLFLTMVLTFGFLYVNAQWSEPTASPPGDNTPAPVNVGSTDQVKSAGLGLDALAVFGNAAIDGYVQMGTTTATCDGSIEGAQRYNDTSKEMEYCNGTEWCDFYGSCTPAPPIVTTNCHSIYDSGGSTGDGLYTIDPDGAGGSAEYDVFCDMSTDGGGWTLVINEPSGSGALPEVATLDIGTRGRLSDTRISELLGASTYTANNVRVDLSGTYNDGGGYQFGMRVDDSEIARYKIPSVSCADWTAGPTAASKISSGAFSFFNGSNNGGAGYEPVTNWRFGINLCSASDLACGWGYGGGCGGGYVGQVWIK